MDNQEVGMIIQEIAVKLSRHPELVLTLTQQAAICKLHCQIVQGEPDEIGHQMTVDLELSPVLGIHKVEGYPNVEIREGDMVIKHLSDDGVGGLVTVDAAIPMVGTTELKKLLGYEHLEIIPKDKLEGCGVVVND